MPCAFCAMIPRSRAAFADLLGTRGVRIAMTSCLAGKPSIPRGLLPSDTPRTGAGGSVCSTDQAGTHRLEKEAKDSLVPRYPRISEIIFKTFQSLLLSQPFPRHCFKVCKFMMLFISCSNKGHSHAENETGEPQWRGLGEVCSDEKNKSCSATN